MGLSDHIHFIFQNNKPLVDEIQKRLKLWADLL